MAEATGRSWKNTIGYLLDRFSTLNSLLAECDTLWSEDMQDGMTIENRLRIANPFHAAR